MPRPAGPDLAAVLAELSELRTRVADLEARMPVGPPDLAQDRRGPISAPSLTLQRAAGTWGVSYEAARKRAVILAGRGLAERRRPGGWQISAEGVRSYVEDSRR